MQPLRHLVSIVLPALNEERTIGEVLMHVNALDFGKIGLSKEVILVDGGSKDRTLEIARSVRGVKTFQLPAGGRHGRGATLRYGLSQARGNVIVFFPSDNEYRATDIYSIVSHIVNNQFEAVFGTRTVKCTDLDAHLRSIYGKSYGLYLLSKYGGILISTLTLFLYNRYVTDSLTSLKAFDAGLLRSLDLKSDGVDLDTEIVAKLSRRRKYILEIPVHFNPRTKAEGKKTGVGDGLRAMRSLIRHRF
jgi:glycosyltransferase involved in cell wall biosynthesis